MWWVLLWVLTLAGSMLSGVATIFTVAIGITVTVEENKFSKLVLAAAGFLFLTIFLGWVSWVSAAMS